MQPRYSPNGKWIAFTSDRGGGDNIWYVSRDGSDPKQVSKETFRLLNSPNWSPDSEYLVARKHFTSERSLGAGEMWIYHRSGGDGLQMTKKRTDQKDSGEPVFSPDGKYVYFSDDITPGQIFEYNKDPNKEIYVIQRLDRDSGEIERYVSGPGGSVRPTPSPDGKSLAFIRRVRYKSTLFVRDLESGRETPLYDGLDRDMQETWAIHGVYPTMAWTPDNKSIVFWSGGTIHRIDVASKQIVTTIHDPSNDTAEIFAASELAKAGLIVAPRIFSTGTILYGAKAPVKADIEKLDDALSHLRRMKAVGAFSVKSYNQPRRDQRQQVIEAARQLQMMVVPEGGSLFQHNMTMIVDGHTGVEHSIPVAKIYDDVVQLWSQTGYTPTLIVGYGGNWGENYWYQKTNVWEDTRLSAFVPRRILDSRSRRRTMVPEDEHNHLNNARIANQLFDAGVSVQLGAHGQRESLGAHWELWMFNQGGMTPLESIRSATLAGARYIGLDKDIGSLEPGKLADLVVLDANPLENVRNSTTVHYTIVNGRIFDAATMNEIGNHPRTRKPFFFQMPGGETWTASTSAASADDDD